MSASASDRSGPIVAPFLVASPDLHIKGLYQLITFRSSVGPESRDEALMASLGGFDRAGRVSTKPGWRWRSARRGGCRTFTFSGPQDLRGDILVFYRT